MNHEHHSLGCNLRLSMALLTRVSLSAMACLLKLGWSTLRIRCCLLPMHCSSNSCPSDRPLKAKSSLLMGTSSKSRVIKCCFWKAESSKRQALASLVQFQMAISLRAMMSSRLLNRFWTKRTPLSMASILSSSRQSRLSMWKVLQKQPSSRDPFSQLTREGRTMSHTQLLTTSLKSSLSLATSSTGNSRSDWYRLSQTDSLRQSYDNLAMSQCLSMSSLQSYSLGIQTLGMAWEEICSASLASSSGMEAEQMVTFRPRLFSSRAVMRPRTPAPMTAQ